MMLYRAKKGAATEFLLGYLTSPLNRCDKQLDA